MRERIATEIVHGVTALNLMMGSGAPVDTPPHYNPTYQAMETGCSLYLNPKGNTLDCADFMVKKSNPESNQVLRVSPRVHNPRSWREWKRALTQGWSDGLQYLESRGCHILGVRDLYYLAEREVVVEDLNACIPELNQRRP